MNKNLILVGIIALIIGGAGGFFGGMQYQKGQATAARAQFAGAFGGGAGGTGTGTGRTRGAGAAGAGGMAVRGTIISKDNNSITVKLPDNSTKIVIIGSSAMIAKSSEGTVDDVTNGSNVTVFGTTNSDGTVTAQLVQVGGTMFGGRPSGSPAASPAAGQ